MLITLSIADLGPADCELKSRSQSAVGSPAALLTALRPPALWTALMIFSIRTPLVPNPQSKMPAVTFKGKLRLALFETFAAFNSSKSSASRAQIRFKRPAPPEEEAVDKSEEINSSVAHQAAGRSD